jgi:hypothetical protein
MGGFSFIKLLQTCQKSKEKLTKSKEMYEYEILPHSFALRKRYV